MWRPLTENFTTKKEEEAYLSRIRSEIIEAVRTNGGHLSSNLGMVETTYALLSSFDPLCDDILFDVGHQSYAYKIMTGRNLQKLRQYHGIAPFTLRSESSYDKYDSGHSGDALPTGIGFALAKGESVSYTVCVVGDASLKNGLSAEALHYLSLRKDLKHLILLVNINGMAIKKETGEDALKNDAIREKWINYRLENRDYFTDSEWKESVKERREKTAKEENPYSCHGLSYLGKAEGHDVLSLLESLEAAKTESEKGPVVLEVLTRKGYGMKEAEEDTIGLYHGVNPGFITGDVRNEFAFEKENILLSLMEKDKDMFVLTPAMETNSCLSRVFRKFPERALDVGIAEENAVSIASGLALKGKHPVVDIYSTFFQRTVDQVLMDFSRQNLSGLFLLERASLVGGDGSSHHGIFDEALLKAIPHATCYFPFDKGSLHHLFEQKNLFSKLTFLRLAKETMPKTADLTYRDITWLRKEDGKLLFLSVGSLGYETLERAGENADKALLLRLDSIDVEEFLGYRCISFYDPYSIEDGVADTLRVALSKRGYHGVFRVLTLPKEFLPAGRNEEILKSCHLDQESALSFFLSADIN